MEKCKQGSIFFAMQHRSMSHTVSPGCRQNVLCQLTNQFTLGCAAAGEPPRRSGFALGGYSRFSGVLPSVIPSAYALLITAGKVVFDFYLSPCGESEALAYASKVMIIFIYGVWGRAPPRVARKPPARAVPNRTPRQTARPSGGGTGAA